MPNLKQITQIEIEEEDYENDTSSRYIRIYQCPKCKDIFEVTGTLREMSFKEEKLNKQHNCNE
jgi:phage FluMu protein Com